MQDRSSKEKRGNKTSRRGQGPPDPNLTAFSVVQRAIGEEPPTELEQKVKNPAAVALGRLGGLKGGKARAAKLSPEQRAEIARMAASVRWKRAD